MDSEPEEELVGSSENTRNWKGIITSLLVIILIIALIIIAVIVRRQPTDDSRFLTPFTLYDVLDKDYEPKRFNGFWLNNKNNFVYHTDSNDIIIFNCTAQNQTVLLSGNNVKQLIGEKFKFWINEDTDVVLFAYDIQQIFRYSFVARYSIYNSRTNKMIDVLPSNSTVYDQIQNAQLSPSGQKLVFVHSNNIYFMDKFKNGDNSVYQVTTNGEKLNIYNGITNWLYEEEILYNSNAIWWSPNNIKFAYLQFNETDVDTYTFPIYDGSIYNNVYKMKYPKPGTKNPIAKAFIYDTQKNETKELTVPDNLKEYYILNVKWKDATSLVVVYTNRKQNSAITCFYNAVTGKMSTIKYPNLESISTWNTPIGLVVSQKYNIYFQIWPSDGYKAIIEFHILTGATKAVTNHKFDVMEILSFDETSGFLYYIATNNDPRERQIYRKNILGHHYIAECLTCEMNLEGTGNCLYNSAIFSTNNNYYILECLGDKIPMTYVKSTKNKTYEYVLERNDELQKLYSSKLLPSRDYLKVYLDNNTNTSSYAELLFPPKFDKDPPDHTSPVLVYVYNGPMSQMVDFQFRVRKFETFLCNTLRVVIAIMDGRGTDANGDKFMKAVYKRLGEVETEDQQTLARALKQQPYTDETKFAIWGWSFGGFVSAMALFNEYSEYNCSISGAPVVDWSYYDSAYTERFLGLLDENKHSYEIISNLMYVAKKNLKFYENKKFLLAHGTGDDNVHFQNSAILAKFLRSTKMDFDFEVYPDLQHTPDTDTSYHLYQRITRFLTDCYGLKYDDYSHLFSADYQKQQEF